MLNSQFEALKNTTCKSKIYKKLLINEYHRNSVECSLDTFRTRTNLFLLASKSGLNEVIECMLSINYIK